MSQPTLPEIIDRKYRVLCALGSGAGGVVYKVRHEDLGVIRALKVFQASELMEDALERFRREAKVMATLEHPNIVRVVDFDVDDEGQWPYLVMEYVEAVSLRDILRRQGRCKLSQVLAVLRQVGLALGYAQAHNPPVVHRDIKPSNVLVEAKKKRVLVTDFGIAKLLGQQDDLTSPNMFVGTPRYSAPEQLLRDGEIDGRADVYALGVTAHELLSGHQVFRGLDEDAIKARLAEEGESVIHRGLAEEGCEVPDALWQLLERATSKQPEQRYATAVELLAALDKIEAEYGEEAAWTEVAAWPPTTPSGAVGASERQRRSRSGVVSQPRTTMLAALALFAVAALLAVAIGAFREWGPSGPAPLGPRVGRLAIAVMNFRQVAGDAAHVWMGNVIRDNLTSQLTRASRQLHVRAQRFIDFEAHELIRKGRYEDPEIARTAVVTRDAIEKLVDGYFRVDGRSLAITANIIVVETREHEHSVPVEGDLSEFPTLQAKLAAEILLWLGVDPGELVEKAKQRGATAGILERYRLLLEAEGLTGGAAQPDPQSTPERRRSRASANRWIATVANAIGPRPAFGAEGSAPVSEGAQVQSGVTSPPGPGGGSGSAMQPALPSGLPSGSRVDPSTATSADLSPKEQIKAALERYRRAFESKNVGGLEQVHEAFTPRQAEASRRYFDTAEDLRVRIEDVDIALGDGQAAVSYTRRDQFTDSVSGEDVTLEVRLTKMFVHAKGGWKITHARP